MYIRYGIRAIAKVSVVVLALLLNNKCESWVAFKHCVRALAGADLQLSREVWSGSGQPVICGNWSCSPWSFTSWWMGSTVVWQGPGSLLLQKEAMG